MRSSIELSNIELRIQQTVDMARLGLYKNEHGEWTFPNWASTDTLKEFAMATFMQNGTEEEKAELLGQVGCTKDDADMQGNQEEGADADMESEEEEELPGELCFCTEEPLTTVSYIMHYGEPGLSYMVQYDTDGHQKWVYIEDKNGTRLQEAKRIFYHNDNSDQLRCEHHTFEDENWTELTYCK